MHDVAQALAAQLPEEIFELIESLVDGPPLTVPELLGQVDAYQQAIGVAVKTHSFPDMDATLGLACGQACRELLEAVGDDPDPREHLLVHIAVRYFVTADDDEDDLESLVGFDDDALVINACARALGQPNAVIPLIPR